jgi:hypothetical protein
MEKGRVKGVHIWRWFCLKDFLYRYTSMEILNYAMVNTLAGLTMSIGYRAIHLFNLTQFIKLLSLIDKPLALIGAIGIIQVGAFGSTYIIYEARRSSFVSKENYESIAKDAPFLEEMFINRRVIGMSK